MFCLTNFALSFTLNKPLMPFRIFFQYFHFQLFNQLLPESEIREKYQSPLHFPKHPILLFYFLQTAQFASNLQQVLQFLSLTISGFLLCPSIGEIISWWTRFDFLFSVFLFFASKHISALLRQLPSQKTVFLFLIQLNPYKGNCFVLKPQRIALPSLPPTSERLPIRTISCFRSAISLTGKLQISSMGIVL